VVAVLLALECKNDRDFKSFWNLRKRILTSVTLYALGATCLFAIFLSGTFTRFKFFIFPVLHICILQSAVDLVHSWFHAANLIAHQGHERAGFHKNDRYILGFYGYLCTLFFILYCIGPMAAFNNPLILNWFVVFGTFHHGVCGAILGVYTDYFGKKLLTKVRPAVIDNVGLDREVSEVFKKVKMFVSMTRLSLIGPAVMILVPIWMGVTQSPSNPGMEYFFYYIFFMEFPSRVWAACSLTWFAHTKSKFLKEIRSSEKSESKNQSSSDQHHRFPSFSIEELTQTETS